MPDITVTVSTGNIERLRPAIEYQLPRLPAETDLQLFKRWIREQATNMVYAFERDNAASNVSSDADILT